MKPVEVKAKSLPSKFKLSPELYGLVKSLSGLKNRGAYHPADLELLELQLRERPRTEFRLYFIRGTQDGRGKGNHRLMTVCIVKKRLSDNLHAEVRYHRGVAVCHPKDSPNPIEGKCRALRRVLKALNSGKSSWARIDTVEVDKLVNAQEFGPQMRDEEPEPGVEVRYAFGQADVTPTGHELEMFAPPKAQRLKDGEPCDHKGCLNHLSHPCEGCGRVAGKYQTPKGVKGSVIGGV